MQVQNMPLPADRPLDRAKRLKVEREGVCASCHRFTGTKTWKEIVRRYGRAATPEEHDLIMQRAVEALSGPKGAPGRDSSRPRNQDRGISEK